jgi:hypothetical protein
MTKTDKKTNSRAKSVPDTGSVDKIRDLIFGTQMQDYEKRFDRLEKNLLKKISDIRTETKKGFDSLEKYTKNEISTLYDTIRTEKNERIESYQKISNDLNNLSKSIQEKLEILSDQTTKSDQSLRQQILDQSKSLSNEVNEIKEDISKALDRAVQELRDEKTDRKALANLLAEMAIRLNHELNLSDLENLMNE